MNDEEKSATSVLCTSYPQDHQNNPMQKPITIQKSSDESSDEYPTTPNQPIFFTTNFSPFSFSLLVLNHLSSSINKIHKNTNKYKEQKFVIHSRNSSLYFIWSSNEA